MVRDHMACCGNCGERRVEAGAPRSATLPDLRALGYVHTWSVCERRLRPANLIAGGRTQYPCYRVRRANHAGRTRLARLARQSRHSAARCFAGSSPRVRHYAVSNGLYSYSATRPKLRAYYRAVRASFSHRLIRKWSNSLAHKPTNIETLEARPMGNERKKIPVHRARGIWTLSTSRHTSQRRCSERMPRHAAPAQRARGRGQPGTAAPT